MPKQPSIKEERTFLMVKPDGVKRGLVGEAIRRVEQRGLKIIGLKMIKPPLSQIEAHYPNTQEWLANIGKKTQATYEKYGHDIKKDLGTDNHIEIGKLVFDWITDHLTSGPMVAMVIEGVHAITMVRKIVGTTYPSESDMGTIRGDYSVDSPVLANNEHRVVHNIVHASGDSTEAAHEIALWFTPTELHDYKRGEEDLMF
ncbi:nucleoside-diphosphate kinase [Candidatus Microgenomates bacterium]|nr:nucleoside-diphosphate kinase [Candidatus Microgenomates bacterium]